MLRRIVISAAAMLCLAVSSGAQTQKIDTVYISELYTTHIIFPTDINYADLSNREHILAKIVDQMRNTFAIRAKESFEGTANISLTENNGVFHTYIIAYRQHPDQLYIDTRITVPIPRNGDSNSSSVPLSAVAAAAAEYGNTSIGSQIMALRRGDAPELQDVLQEKRTLYHLTSKCQKVTVSCANIFAYSDITYIVIELENKSGVSYETKDATFVIEDSDKSKRKVKPEPIPVLPKNRLGNLTAAVGTVAKVAYSFDKITLAQDQVLKVYIYEKNGQRNHAITLTPEDVNLAKQPSKKTQ